MAGQKIQSLQLLRFGAAAMVLDYHAQIYAHTVSTGGWWLGRFSNLGAAGVDIFFVLSGAVIFRAMRAADSGGAFAWCRFSRIAPLYYLITLAWIPMRSLIGVPAEPETIATAFTFWPAWSVMKQPAIGPGWTLCFEMLFYMSTALAIWRREMIGALLLGFAACWYARLMIGWTPFQFLGNPIMLEFLAGVAVSILWRPRLPAPAWFGCSVIAIGFALFFAIPLPPDAADANFTLSGLISLTRAAVWGFPAAVILLGALMVEPHLDRRLAPLVFLGDASYAIYLAHWPVVVLTTLTLPKGSLPVGAVEALLVLLSIGCGVALHIFVEKPLLHSLRRVRIWMPQIT